MRKNTTLATYYLLVLIVYYGQVDNEDIWLKLTKTFVIIFVLRVLFFVIIIWGHASMLVLSKAIVAFAPQ